MHKSTLLSLFLFFCIGAYSQINLEHTFTANTFSTWYFNTEDETYYYFADGNSNTLYFYQSDYILYKSINFNPPAGYDLYYVYHPSEKLFNDDELIEFILVFYNSSQQYQMKLYNEELVLIKDLGQANTAYVFPTGDGYKLKTSQMTYNSSTQSWDYTDKIYSLPGELYVSNKKNSFPPDQVIGAVPYPNPADDIITIPYTLDKNEIADLMIFNSEGQIIDMKKIHGHFSRVQLKTTSLFPGVYFYRYNNAEGQFVVK